MSISKERSGENRPGRKRCQDVASWRFSNNGGASRLGKPSITIPDVFDWNSNWSKIARLSGSNSWFVLGCTTWWHISGRFFWNIKNVDAGSEASSTLQLCAVVLRFFGGCQNSWRRISLFLDNYFVVVTSFPCNIIAFTAATHHNQLHYIHHSQYH